MNTFDKTLKEVKGWNKLWVLQILPMVQITFAVWQLLLMTSAGHLILALHSALQLIVKNYNYITDA
jgi:hypothetical protein